MIGPIVKAEVFVAVRKDLKSSRQSEIETDCENVWVKLEIPNSPNIYIYICSYCRPNVNDNEGNLVPTISFEGLPRNCSTYIAGDFNYPGIKWPEATIQQALPTTTSMLISLTPFTTMAWNKLSTTQLEKTIRLTF